MNVSSRNGLSSSKSSIINSEVSQAPLGYSVIFHLLTKIDVIYCHVEMWLGILSVVKRVVLEKVFQLL